MIADAFKPHERGTALGIFLTGIVLGGPTAIWFGGYVLALADTGALTYWPVIGQLAGWRLVLVILALASLLFPLAMLGVREPLRRERPSLEKFELSGALRTWKLLMPLLLGIALLSVGDYGILSWAPTALIRAFSWPADRVGAAVGLVTAVAGVTGALLGGVLADAAARRAGELARLTVTATAAVFGLAGALMVMAPHPLVVLAGVGLWMLSSSIGATSGISVLQSLVPPGLRGTGMSLVAFCNTLLGLGLGPTAVARVSDAYGGPMGTSWAITMVVGPAATLSAILLATVRRSRSAKAHST
jgi:MFS family permease